MRRRSGIAQPYLSLDHFDAVDVAFDDAGAVRQGQVSSDESQSLRSPAAKLRSLRTSPWMPGRSLRRSGPSRGSAAGRPRSSPASVPLSRAHRHSMDVAGIQACRGYRGDISGNCGRVTSQPPWLPLTGGGSA
jgi:hypothetical protein